MNAIKPERKVSIKPIPDKKKPVKKPKENNIGFDNKSVEAPVVISKESALGKGITQEVKKVKIPRASKKEKEFEEEV